MAVTDEMLSRYSREIDYYEQAARLAAQLLEEDLRQAGIRCIVTSRAKSLDSLREKLGKRKKNYTSFSLEQVYEDIVDLAGVRVALYFPSDRNAVRQIINELFELRSKVKRFPEKNAPLSSVNPNVYENRFRGYGARHFRVNLKGDKLSDGQKRYAVAAIEIQVASVLMHAWAEVNHDLAYKPLQGELSREEYAILDQVNGLVIAGEIALEQLKRAEKRRVATGIIKNHYELSAYLLQRVAPNVRQSHDSILGRVDLLFELLLATDLATAAKLQPFIENLSDDFEKRAIADQVIERIITGDPARYEIFERIRSRFPFDHNDTESSPSQTEALSFLNKWIEFERLVSNLAEQKLGKSRPIFPNIKLLRELDLIDSKLEPIFLNLRSIRNNLVHGIENPPGDLLARAKQDIDILIDRVKHQKPIRRVVKPE